MWIALLGVAIVLPACAAAAQGMPRVLVVDATKSFASTLRVGALVGALRGTGAVAVDVHLAEGRSFLDDPLPAEPQNGVVYDLLILIPRGLDDGSAERIWIVSDAPSHLAPSAAAALVLVQATVDAVFDGLGYAVDVTEDLYPAFLWAGYRARGWVR
jgi:hypothetical protein